MQALLHVLNVGTLATWLSVGTFGTVGIVIPGWQEVFAAKSNEPLESVWITPDITLGDPGASEDAEASLQSDVAESEEALAPPPELPQLTELPPLPEVPDLPPPPKLVEKATKPSPAPANRRSAPAPQAKPANSRPARPATTSPNKSGNGGSTAATTGRSTGMSNSARLAAGRMPSPSYPPYSRQNRQTGTVIIEFTVDASGRVISASVKSSSSWPLLDSEAVRTVRRWKFPPGGVMKLQRPIVFRLK